MIDALSPTELATVWVALRDAGSPEAESYRQALLRRLKALPRWSRDAIRVYSQLLPVHCESPAQLDDQIEVARAALNAYMGAQRG